MGVSCNNYTMNWALTGVKQVTDSLIELLILPLGSFLHSFLITADSVLLGRGGEGRGGEGRGGEGRGGEGRGGEGRGGEGRGGGRGESTECRAGAVNSASYKVGSSGHNTVPDCRKSRLVRQTLTSSSNNLGLKLQLTHRGKGVCFQTIWACKLTQKGKGVCFQTIWACKLTQKGKGVCFQTIWA